MLHSNVQVQKPPRPAQRHPYGHIAERRQRRALTTVWNTPPLYCKNLCDKLLSPPHIDRTRQALLHTQRQGNTTRHDQILRACSELFWAGESSSPVPLP